MVGIIENTEIGSTVRASLNRLLAPIIVEELDSFQVSETHRNKRVLASKATTLTVTLPNDLPVGFVTSITHDGASDQITFVAEAGASITTLGSFTATPGRYASAMAWVKANAGGTSAVWQLDGFLTTLDAPNLTFPFGLSSGSGNALISAITPKGDGTIHWVVTQSATTPTEAQIIAGNDHTGTAADAAGTIAVTARGQQGTTTTGLTNAVDLYAHMVHIDGQLNHSTPVTSSAFQTAAAVAATFWVDFQSGVTITNAGLTATITADFARRGVRAHPVPTGSKRYFSVVIDDPGIAETYVGIANTTWPLGGGTLGNTVDGISMRVSSTLGLAIRYNNVSIAEYQIFTVNFGDIVDVAVDDAADKVWFRYTPAGGVSNGWNNAPLGVQNPASGIGGFDITGITSSRYPIWNNGIHPDIVTHQAATAQFAVASWTNLPPAGYLQIDAV